MLTIVSASLNPDSHSRLLALAARQTLEQDGEPVHFLDLRDHPLPLCDGQETSAHPQVAQVRRPLEAADGMIVASPIYNYDGSAALKNLIELTGDAWENKVVGFLCAAGGMNSYMSILPFANSLMLDFRCVIVPRFVYATGRSFSGGRIVDASIQERVAELARTTARLARSCSSLAA